MMFVLLSFKGGFHVLPRRSPRPSFCCHLLSGCHLPLLTHLRLFSPSSQITLKEFLFKKKKEFLFCLHPSAPDPSCLTTRTTPSSPQHSPESLPEPKLPVLTSRTIQPHTRPPSPALPQPNTVLPEVKHPPGSSLSISSSSSSFKTTFVCICVHVETRGHFQELAPSFHHVSSGDRLTSSGSRPGPLHHLCHSTQDSCVTSMSQSSVSSAPKSRCRPCLPWGGDRATLISAFLAVTKYHK